ncbi:two-component regulator propeller domain-containing protein [Carboxylicivirga sp. N1Y90]|uniref:hybrid sensor histidine kinase/response regulator transcription factor n=1 Tax=Carboxylicivirga fragile TaxID=3417571 RepID=UPI003D33A030|nr:response regulator [Marinilabiliaceae bacterium N1Y90]
MKKQLLFVVILMALAFTGRAQKQYSFLQVNNTNGLVNNQVTCIHKDTRGFIWVGTVAGLSRFDGSSFVNYKHNPADTTSLIDNYILTIQEDARGGIWIKTTWGYTVLDTNKEVLYNNVNEYLGQGASHLNISEIYCDKGKQLWILEYDQLHYKKWDAEIKQCLSLFPEGSVRNRIILDFMHVNDAYYCLFNDGVIECYSDSNFELNYQDDYLCGKLGSDSLNVKMCIDYDSDIWFYGNNKGVYHYDKNALEWNHYSINSKKIALTSDLIRKIIQDDKGLIWVGTDHGGIDVINKYTNEVKHIYHQEDNQKSIAQNTITDLYLDNNNIVWVGTYKNGLSYYHESIHKFPHYRHVLSDKSSLPFSDVNCFVEDEKGNLWIGTNGGGLIYFNRNTNTFKSYKYDRIDPNSLSSNVVVSLFIDSYGELWIGTYAGGLNRFNGTSFKRYQHGSLSAHGLSNNNIWSILEDNNKQLYIGSLGGGIDVYDRKSDSFAPLPNRGEKELLSVFINQIIKLSNGNLFIATADGVTFYDVNEKRYKNHPDDYATKAYPIGHKTVYDVFEDSRGLLWTATREGLYVFNPNTNFFKYFTEADGIPHDIINCIKEDLSNKIWISKSTGLSQIIVNEYAPQSDYTFWVYDYTEEDGLQGKEFNPNASYLTSKNELIFGGPNGFNLFDPRNVKYNKKLPKVVITDFQIYNQSISPSSKVRNNKLLEKSIESTEKITIKHTMNVISIDFAALDFFIPEKTRYKYKLEGFNEEWLLLENTHKVTYTNLNAGDYYFKVKAANNDGLWNDEYTQLHIKVLPPFYATPLAYFLYVLCIILIIIYFRYSMLRKERIKFEVEQERFQAKRNHEMDEMKLRFLTNVSHEFRTPLTLILTPLHKLLDQKKGGEDKKLLKVIDRNAKQLLGLVNQLLDFRKLELHGLKYNPSYGNLVVFLDEVIRSFEEEFTKKNIEFIFSHSLDKLMLNFDKDKLMKVIMNLLSNALKFTPENGKVTLVLKADELKQLVQISVSDNGVGIKKDDKDKVFTRFYQSENNKKLGISGSGIGLNLALEMVQLHKGTIRFESEEGKGATFIVELPIIKQAEEKVAVKDSSNDNEAIMKSELPETSTKPTLMLVEDNIDFRTFMKETLAGMFEVYEAADGKIASELVYDVVPDLIISDVMMPNVDGLELCKMLRNDIRTSHIPFILLTARTADEDKIKGLEIGADDYITKPFNMDLLMLRVNKLLEKRSKQQKQFQKTIEIDPGEVKITSMDEKLIKKAIDLVNKNIGESSFSVEDFSQELGMSRVYLYKKMTSLTGKSPIEFIRIIRLKRGAQLLEKSQMNISEVAYEVGFNSPRLFSKYFKNEYGMLPNVYVKVKQKKKA